MLPGPCSGAPDCTDGAPSQPAGLEHQTAADGALPQPAGLEKHTSLGQNKPLLVFMFSEPFGDYMHLSVAIE